MKPPGRQGAEMNTVPTEELPGWGRRGEEFLVVVLNYYISS